MPWHVKQIPPKDAHYLILNVHYARRLPSISYAFALFDEVKMLGICTFGSPASPSLCIGVCGPEYKKRVIELNRLCLTDNPKNGASFLVSNAIKLLPSNMIVVSYADVAQGHHGGVYQASNFYFTGTSKPRTDMASKDGKHSRHSLGDPTLRVARSAKHRYIIFTGSKTNKNFLKSKLLYPILPYPKDLIGKIS